MWAQTYGKGLANVFLSTTTNTLDGKGRVSVPANFRARINGESVVVWPSFEGDYLEGATLAYMERLLTSLDDLDFYDEAREALNQAIFAASRELAFDSGGRVKLPADLIEHAQLSDKAAFVGLGRTFQIWDPDAHAAHMRRARETAREHRHKLASPRSLAPPRPKPQS